MTASARQRPEGAPRGRSQLTIRVLPNTNPQLPRWLAANLLREQGWGRRPQRPGNQLALMRTFWKFPLAIPLENHRCHWPAAINQQAQELSRFAADTLIHFVLPGKTKSAGNCEQPVEDRTSLWKNEENLELTEDNWTAPLDLSEGRILKWKGVLRPSTAGFAQNECGHDVQAELPRIRRRASLPE